MSISIEKRGPIVDGVEKRLKELLKFITENQDRNSYITKEMSAYSFSLLKGQIEDLIADLED